MGQDVSNKHFSGQDFKAFSQRLAEETSLLESWFKEHAFEHGQPTAGFELEAWLCTHDGLPAAENEAFLDALNNPLVVAELARFNIELNGTPQILKQQGLNQLEKELATTWNSCQRQARTMDLDVIMIGHLPTVCPDDLTLANMSQLARFQALNEQVLRLRHGSPLTLNIQGREHLRTAHCDVMPEAAATSFQIHLQVRQGQAVRHYNAALIAAAPLLAASANSPFLFNRDLWDETRIPLFEQAIAMHDMPQRVTFGSGYVQHSLFECFQENLRDYPVLLPACTSSRQDRLYHVRLHNGTVWRWVRPLIGFDSHGCPHLRIEQRVVPAGPTVIDAIANAAFYYGLSEHLANLDHAVENELSFRDAESNFYAAARCGLDARIVWPGDNRLSLRQALLESLIPSARQGLSDLGIDPRDSQRYMDIIEERVRSGRTGSWWQRAYRQRHNADMQQLLCAYRQRQQSGHAVHCWPL